MKKQTHQGCWSSYDKSPWNRV